MRLLFLILVSLTLLGTMACLEGRQTQSTRQITTADHVDQIKDVCHQTLDHRSSTLDRTKNTLKNTQSTLNRIKQAVDDTTEQIHEDILSKAESRVQCLLYQIHEHPRNSAENISSNLFEETLDQVRYTLELVFQRIKNIRIRDVNLVHLFLDELLSLFENNTLDVAHDPIHELGNSGCIFLNLSSEVFYLSCFTVDKLTDLILLDTTSILQELCHGSLDLYIRGLTTLTIRYTDSVAALSIRCFHYISLFCCLTTWVDRRCSALTFLRCANIRRSFCTCR